MNDIFLTSALDMYDKIDDVIIPKVDNGIITQLCNDGECVEYRSGKIEEKNNHIL